MNLDTRALASRLKTIESVASISTITSTNSVARQVADECVENELPFPSVTILAREQTEGKGRASRSWYSPKDKGIYATTMHTREAGDFGLLPLEIGIIVASFLRETYGIDARLKWPNDVLVGGRKIAGILIEARIHEDQAALIIGTGINVEKLGPDAPENSTSIAEELRGDRSVDLVSATEAFVEHLDRGLGQRLDRDEILKRWRASMVHEKGDAISVVLHSGTVSGTWDGIDDDGRAVIREGEKLHHISAGDLITG